jgi:hypothetical protein
VAEIDDPEIRDLLGAIAALDVSHASDSDWQAMRKASMRLGFIAGSLGCLLGDGPGCSLPETIMKLKMEAIDR